MNVLIAPDSFKECLSADAAASVMKSGVRKACSAARVRCRPLADGGEGTVRVLTRALGGRFFRTRVRAPLGNWVRARWGWVAKTRTAFLEMAEASGLTLVPSARRDPFKTSTYGTGQLIRAALDKGCRRIILGIGGSATVDAGLGMAQALGAKVFLAGDEGRSRRAARARVKKFSTAIGATSHPLFGRGTVPTFRNKLKEGTGSARGVDGSTRPANCGGAGGGAVCRPLTTGADLIRLVGIDVGELDPRIGQVEILVACDVGNGLYGPQGAAYVYGPQKGADPRQVKVLDEGLRRFAWIVRKDLEIDVSGMPGGGAAGGLGACLRALLGARLVSGIDLVLSVLEIEKEVRWADIIFTGEGRVDAQSASGKVPAGLARLAKRWRKPLVILTGGLGDGAEKILGRGATAVIPIADPLRGRRRAFREAPMNLAKTAEIVMRQFVKGKDFEKRRPRKSFVIP